MTLPSSGPLSISQIKAELGSTSNSLKTLSIAAGFTAPYKISKFYGYSSTPTVAPTNLDCSDTSYCDTAVNVFQATGTWSNTSTSYDIDVAWYEGTTLMETHSLTKGSTSDSYLASTGGVSVKFEARYKAGSPGPWSAFSAPVTIQNNPCGI